MLKYMTTLAKRVTERRLELKAQKRDGANWSQSYVADKITTSLKRNNEKAKCSQQAYQAVEKGKSNNPSFLIELAAALYTTPAWLKHGKKDGESLIATSAPPPEFSQNEKSPRQQALAAQAAAIKAFEDLSPEALEYVDIDALIRMLRSFFVNPEPNIRTDEQKAKIKSK